MRSYVPENQSECQEAHSGWIMNSQVISIECVGKVNQRTQNDCIVEFFYGILN